MKSTRAAQFPILLVRRIEGKDNRYEFHMPGPASVAKRPRGFVQAVVDFAPPEGMVIFRHPKTNLAAVFSMAKKLEGGITRLVTKEGRVLIQGSNLDHRWEVTQ